jgi:hypothetical protein
MRIDQRSFAFQASLSRMSYFSKTWRRQLSRSNPLTLAKAARVNNTVPDLAGQIGLFLTRSKPLRALKGRGNLSQFFGQAREDLKLVPVAAVLDESTRLPASWASGSSMAFS